MKASSLRLAIVLYTAFAFACSDEDVDPALLATGAAPGRGSASEQSSPIGAGRRPEQPQANSAATNESQPAAGSDASMVPAPTPRQRSDRSCIVSIADAQPVDYWAPGPHTPAILEFTFEDTSRPIEQTDSHAAQPSRILETRIHYPASGPAPLFGTAPVADGGPFPLLMYSHGFSSSRDEGNQVGEHMASHGYIVVAPTYPLTNINANDGMPDIDDVANQPGDVSFLIDRMVDASADPNHVLAGAVDDQRIGALGVSLGGLTTLLVGYHADFHEPRVSAIAPIAAPSYFFATRYYDLRDLPLPFVHGDLDAFIDIDLNARTALDRAAPSAQLLTVLRGTHTGFGAPVDGALLGLVQPLFAPPDAHPQNADGLGCGYVADDLENTGPEFLDAIGGPEQGIETTEEQNLAAQPCTGDEYQQPGLDVDRQMDILSAAMAAYFSAHFAADEGTRSAGCRFLGQELTNAPEVVLEF